MKRLWCRLFHRRILWPGASTYTCATCLEEWPNVAEGEGLWYKKKRNQQFGRFAGSADYIPNYNPYQHHENSACLLCSIAGGGFGCVHQSGPSSERWLD